MKSAYELAMERLNKTSPSVKLTDQQKQEIGEIDSRYAAKLAEREILRRDEIARVRGTGDEEKAAVLEREWAIERRSLEEEREDKKERVRRKA